MAAIWLAPCAWGANPIVFEAEEPTEMSGAQSGTGGAGRKLPGTWELRADPDSSGGAVFFVGEGTGRNNTGTYYPPRQSFIGRAVYVIDIPEAGTYTLWGRCWSTDQCSNSCWVGFDDGTPVYFPEGQEGAASFVWSADRYLNWLWLKLPPVRLSAGRHRMRLEVREDGFKIDQWALMPAGGPQPSGKLEPNAHPVGPEEVWMRVDPRSRVVHAGGRDVVSVWFRKRTSRGLKGRLEVAAPEGVGVSPRRPELSLAADEVLGRIDVTLRHPEDFPRGEHAYRFTFTPEGGGEGNRPLVAQIRLSRPFLWEVLAPLPFRGGEGAEHRDRMRLTVVPSSPPPASWPGRGDEVRGPVGSTKLSGRRGLTGPVRWRKARELDRWFTPYGFLDFGQALGSVRNAKAYARTTVTAPEAGIYLFEVLSDDESCMWVNGRLVYRNPRRQPAADHYGKVSVKLKKGLNDIALAVRQWSGSWEMRVRIRRPDGPSPRRPAGTEPLRGVPSGSGRAGGGISGVR